MNESALLSTRVLYSTLVFATEHRQLVSLRYHASPNTIEITHRVGITTVTCGVYRTRFLGTDLLEKRLPRAGKVRQIREAL